MLLETLEKYSLFLVNMHIYLMLIRTSKYEFSKILSYFFSWNYSINLHNTGNFVKIFPIKATKLFGHIAYLRSVIKHAAAEMKAEYILSGCSGKASSPKAFLNSETPAPIQCLRTDVIQ